MIITNHNNKAQEATTILYKLGTGVNQIGRAINYTQTQLSNVERPHPSKDTMYDMRATFIKTDYKPEDILQLEDPRPSLYLLAINSPDIRYFRLNPNGTPSFRWVGEDHLVSRSGFVDTGTTMRWFECRCGSQAWTNPTRCPYSWCQSTNLTHYVNYSYCNSCGSSHYRPNCTCLDGVPRSVLFPRMKQPAFMGSGCGCGSGGGANNAFTLEDVFVPDYDQYVEARYTEDFFIEFPLTKIYGMRYIAHSCNVGYFDNVPRLTDNRRLFNNLLQNHTHKIVRNNFFANTSAARPGVQWQPVLEVRDVTIMFDFPVEVNNLAHSFERLTHLQYYVRPVAGIIKDKIFNGVRFEEFPEQTIPLEESLYVSDVAEKNECGNRIVFTNTQTTALDVNRDIGVGGIIRIQNVIQSNKMHTRAQKHYPLSKYLVDPEEVPPSASINVAPANYVTDEWGMVRNGRDDRMPIIFTRSLPRPTLIKECLWIRTDYNPLITGEHMVGDVDVGVYELLIEGYNTADGDNIWRPLDILVFPREWVHTGVPTTFQGKASLSYHRRVDRLRMTVMSVIHNSLTTGTTADGYRPFRSNVSIGWPQRQLPPKLDLRFRYLYIPELLFF